MTHRAIEKVYYIAEHFVKGNNFNKLHVCVIQPLQSGKVCQKYNGGDFIGSCDSFGFCCDSLE